MVKSLVRTHGYAKLHLTREALVSKHTYAGTVVDCQAAAAWGSNTRRHARWITITFIVISKNEAKETIGSRSAW